MQKSTSFTTKILSLLFPGFLTFFIISSLLSCTGTDNKSEKNSLTDQSDTTKGLKLNCVILTKAQVQAWVDSGWTKPGAQIKELVFQPFIADVNAINANMQLVVYPGQSSIDVKLYGKQELAIDTSCTGKRISGPLTLGNLSMKFDSLKILNPDGSLKDFDFIRFVPAQDHPPHINFNFEVVNKGEVQLRDPGPIGCPPACCPPYCN